MWRAPTRSRAADRRACQARRTRTPGIPAIALRCGDHVPHVEQGLRGIGNTGGVFRLPKESAFETAAAAETLAGDEFIFDVQTHLVDPTGAWRSSAGKYWAQIFAGDPQGHCGEEDPVACFSSEKYIKHVFMDSDTDLAVLSFVPELPENNPLSLEEADRVRVLVNQMEGAERLFLHAMVIPNAPEIAPLQLMKDASIATRSRPGSATRNGALTAQGLRA